MRFVIHGDRIFLQLAIRHQDDRQRRWRHGNLVGSHRGLAEVRERGREIVPLGEVTNHRRRVLYAMGPFDSGNAFGCVHNVSENQVDWDAIAPGVVNGHRGVLYADRSVREHRQRLAFDLCVAVSHGDGRLFVTAGDELRIFISSIVNNRFVNTSETRPWIGANIFKAQ